MKKLYTTLLFITFILSFVSAIEIDDLGKLCSTSGVAGKELPSAVPFSNEIFNLYTGENSSVILGSLKIENKKIKSLDCKENENVTMTIYIKDKKTINDILNSEDMLESYLDKKSSGELIIKGASFSKKTKLFFANIGARIASWFM